MVLDHNRTPPPPKNDRLGGWLLPQTHTSKRSHQGRSRWIQKAKEWM